MISYSNALIAVQARSTSKRFPNKVSALIDGKPLLDHVLAACFSAQKYVNRNSSKTGVVANVALLIPTGDPLKDKYSRRLDIFEGPEDDVLQRYYDAAKEAHADYIVRITGDCPLVPPYLISKAITILTKGDHEFVSNADDSCRTSIDGVDVEAMTFKALEWAYRETSRKESREHVTPLMYGKTPEWFSVACLMGFVDLSTVKLSVDTEEDLTKVDKMFQRINSKIKRAEEKYGKGCIYRF